MVLDLIVDQVLILSEQSESWKSRKQYHSKSDAMGSTSGPFKPFKRKGSASALLGRYFTKQPPTSVFTTMSSKSSDLDIMEELCEDLLDDVHPPPYINPLGCRLQPRVEDAGVKRPTSATSSQGGPSRITIARNRGMAQRQLNGDLSPNYTIDDEEDAKMEDLILDIVSFGPIGDVGRKSYCSLSINAIAKRAATNISGLDAWVYFLNCYAEVCLYKRSPAL
jgi:hypothetical protein